MKNIFLATVILFAVASAAFGQKTDEKAAALALVDQLFTEMETANPAGIASLFLPDAQLAAAIKKKDGKTDLEMLNRDTFSKFFTDKKAVVEERMYDPKVAIDGDWAMVWGRYIFFVNKRSHTAGSINLICFVLQTGGRSLTLLRRSILRLVLIRKRK